MNKNYVILYVYIALQLALLHHATRVYQTRGLPFATVKPAVTGHDHVRRELATWTNSVTDAIVQLSRLNAMATERVYVEPRGTSDPTGAAAALSGGTREQTAAAEEGNNLSLAYSSSLTNLDRNSKVSS